MRLVYFVILLIFLGLIGTFAVLNSEPVAINYLDQSFTKKSVDLPMAVLIGGVYVFGMLSGWTVIGFIKRSLEHVTERPRQ